MKFISIGYLDGSGLFFTYGKLYEFDIDSINELNLLGELENGQQMTELTLLSSENENINQNNN